MNESKQTPGTDADPNSISIEAALQTILKNVATIEQSETIAVSQAAGRVLYVDLKSPIDVPSFRASAMDGYAFRHDDAPHDLIISDRSLAGHPSSNNANERECHRITTGARVPDFADTVVQQENVEVSGKVVRIEQQPERGHHVRAAGSDCVKGTKLMGKGQQIGAAQIATLCAHGVVEIEVFRRIKVAVFSTGDELVDAGNALPAGSIYDANRALLSAMINNPAVQVSDLGIVADSHDALQRVFAKCEDADLIVSSGGVSVGDADYVRPILERIGTLHIWKIAVKPGRPLTFGLLDKNQPYFGLPGNPVSAAVTCLLFVQPAIRKLLGHAQIALPRINAQLTTPLKKLPGRVEYQRGLLEQDENGLWRVTTTGLQDSHVVSSLHHANCFIELGFDSAGAPEGAMVDVIPFAHFANNVL